MYHRNMKRRVLTTVAVVAVIAAGGIGYAEATKIREETVVGMGDGNMFAEQPCYGFVHLGVCHRMETVR